MVRGGPAVKVLTGIRRSGKTVLLLHLIREELRARGDPDSRLIFVNCESNADPRVNDREYLYGLIRTAAGSDNGRIYESGITGAAVRQYLSDVFDSILLKDVAQRHRVRDIEYAREACFLHLVPREDVREKRVLSFEEKIFVTDHGFREALFGSNQRDIQQVLENIVYMELLRRGWTVRIGKNGNTEVDFACENGGQRLYVQVSYLLAAASTIEREFSALETIPDQYPKLVLTMDRLEMSRNGIRHKNVADWLLEDWE